MSTTAATMTTTAVFSSASPTSSLVVSGSSFSASSSSGSSSRVVRFESECVLIPESPHRSRRQLMATKTYSVPLWKRRQLTDPTTNEDPTSSIALSSSPEDTHIVLRLPIPSFMSKSRSPTRSPTLKPLSPCIRHTPSGHFLVSPPTPIRTRRPRTPTRSPSLPLPTTHRQVLVDPSSPTPTTIPLRACCPDCFPITEECLKEGVHWQEKFTRGARRRRSASLDSYGSDPSEFPSHSPSPPSSKVVAEACILNGLGAPTGGFAAVACPAKNAAAVVTSRFSGTGPCAITVDEVDKRRRSADASASSAFAPTRVREASYSSVDSADSSILSAAGEPYTPTNERKPSSSPIAEIDEDDEDQLFPLPSPRRSPSVSPTPGSHRSGSRSPSIRSMNSAPPSPANSIPPSPNGSTACLNNGASGSRDSLRSTGSSSDEAFPGKGKGKRSGKNRCEKGFLTPPDRSARSRLAEGADKENLADEGESKQSSPPVSGPSVTPIIKVPKPSRTVSNPVPPSSEPVPSTSSSFPSSAPSPSSPLRSRSPVTKFDEDNRQTRSNPTPSRGKSPGSKRSRSLSIQGGKRRRPSFSLPSPVVIFADMLKGVSSMGMGMTGSGH